VATVISWGPRRRSSRDFTIQLGVGLQPQFFAHSFLLLGFFLQPLREMVVESDILTKYKPFEDLSLLKSHDQLFWCSIGGDVADFFMVHELITREWYLKLEFYSRLFNVWDFCFRSFTQIWILNVATLCTYAS
jgi:hypothetical protein